MESSQPRLEVPSAVRDAVVREWLARVLESYPEQTSRFLLQDEDPFRNPIGRALRRGLPLLFELFAGGFAPDKAKEILTEIIHIRAVQDFAPGAAVGFIFEVKPILGEHLGPDTAALNIFNQRVDETALVAFDLFMECREKMYEIKANEARRRVYLLERTAGMRH